MPVSNLFALLDDIATVLDDVAVLTKVASKKTAGVLGDDLALNAQQVTGVETRRELPVVWAVAKGSARNKAILVPAALAISALIPWAVTPLLMLGGAFLCFEGFEKIAHKWFHPKEEEAEREALRAAVRTPEVDLVAFEKEKVQGAVRTDFVLSAEIVAITLGIVAERPFFTQVVVLVLLSALMTVGVYGLVAGIVKLDDFGRFLYLRGEKAGGGVQRSAGKAILWSAPYLMKALSVGGTIAMFLVGGGILSHGIPAVAALVHHASDAVATVPGAGPVLAAATPTLADGLIGLLAGAVLVLLFTLAKGLLPKRAGAAQH